MEEANHLEEKEGDIKLGGGSIRDFTAFKVAVCSKFCLAFMFNKGSSSSIHPTYPNIGMEIPYYNVCYLAAGLS